MSTTATTMTGARDYLAMRIKPAQIKLSEPQREAVRTYLINAIPSRILNPFVRMDAHERRATIDRALEECVRAGTLLAKEYPGDHPRETFASPSKELLESMYAQVVGLDALDPLLQDEDVSSITVINESTILYEKGGLMYQSPYGFETRDRMMDVIKNLAIRGGQQLTPTQPTADLAFPPPQVVRIHLTIDPVTPRFGAFCALRRGREKAWTLETLTGKGMMDDDVADFLRALMRIPVSLIVGGEPSSGKTTLLESLLSLMEGQHISLLEQAAELNPRNPLISFFEVPPTSNTVSLATLTIDSLRKNVQVVVIGETRGAEAGWLLFIAGAMKAILTTLHGRSSRQVIERLATNAQIQGDPPISPFVGNKALAYQAIASAFDFVVHCTQLPDGRRIVDAIEYVAGVEGETIKLEVVVKARVEVVDTGRKRIQVRWEWSNNWQGDGLDGHCWKLPADLAFDLQMAQVRAEVGQEEPGALSAKQHELYQRACLAFDQQSYALTVRLFTEVLRHTPAGYLDAETKLRRALQAAGQWDDLLAWADQFLARVKTLARDRQWRPLEAAVKDMDDKPELRVAVHAKQALKELREQLQKGLGLEQKWAEGRRKAATLIEQGKANLVAVSLRQFPVNGLNDDLKDEVRRLRLETLAAWLKLPSVSDDAALRVYHEMFALVDEETEPNLMVEVLDNIRQLEQRIGKVDINVETFNVSAYTQRTAAKRDEVSLPPDRGHHLYLQGVLAMNENRWAEALTCFRQIPTYRRAATFIKSLETLQGE